MDFVFGDGVGLFDEDQFAAEVEAAMAGKDAVDDNEQADALLLADGRGAETQPAGGGADSASH